MKIAYQPHIDILRAMAVLLVIFNHLDINFFSGGFIGVDIFFVISGYLISKNIINEKKTTHNFLYKKFYTRRVIRLAPAFFTVITVCTFFFLIIMTPEETSNYLKTIIASITLSSNIYYTTLLSNYFSITTKSTPLLHIWSLSLEEQFYLIWPFFLIFILRFKIKIQILSIICAVIISLFISHKMVQNAPIAAYYLLPSRAFEFIIGSLITLIPYKKIHIKLSIFLGSISFIGLIFVSHIINKDSIFPSYTALAPCLLSAIFIYSAYGLSCKYTKFFEYLGKISYPMYLWHWPLIVYLSLLSINLSVLVKLLIIIMTFALSVVTYELIEIKVKKKSITIKKPIHILFILPSVLIILSCILYIQHKDQDKQSNNNAKLYNTENNIKCIDQSQHPHKDCFFGDQSKKQISILLVGDSHANAQSGFIDYLAKDIQLSGYEKTFSSTAFLPHIDRSTYNIQTKKNQSIESFKKTNDEILTTLKMLKPKTVVMGGFFPHNWERSIYSSPALPNATSKDVFIHGISNAIVEIQKIGAKPILINDNPILVDIDINCNLRKSADQCYFEKEKHVSDFYEWKSILTALKQKHPELTIIDFNDIICIQTKCYSSLNNIPLYRDNQHMTYRGSQEIAIEYLKTHKNPFNSTHTQ